jgi:hypothetical protein
MRDRATVRACACTCAGTAPVSGVSGLFGIGAASRAASVDRDHGAGDEAGVVGLAWSDRRYATVSATSSGPDSA